MKKFVLVVCLLVVALSLTQTVFAFAQAEPAQKTAQYTEKDIADFVKQNKNVNNAHVVVCGNKCLVAIQPKEVLTKSQFGEFKSNMRKEIAEKFDGIEEVYITFNVRAFKEVEKMNSMNANEKQKMFDKLVEHMSNRRRNPHSSFDNDNQQNQTKPNKNPNGKPEIRPFDKPEHLKPMPKKGKSNS